MSARICPRGSTGGTDNDWFVFLSEQQGIDEASFLPKTTCQKTAGKSASPPQKRRTRKTADKSARKRRINLKENRVRSLALQMDLLWMESK
jgi:hypothetical protein